MKNYFEPYFSEKKYIKNQSATIAEEKLSFMRNKRLGDVSISIADNATLRKIRRIIEKKIAQRYWKNAGPAKLKGNRVRYETKHHMANHFKNIYGTVPEGFRYAA